MSTLYKLYKEQKKKELSNQFIEDAFQEMLKKEKELLPYITGFEICEEEGKLLGGYSNYQRKIEIHKKNIESQISNVNTNLIALEVIRHEMEHARNLKILEEDKKDIESLVIKYSLKDYAIEKGWDYPTFQTPFELWMLPYRIKENYEVNPGERLAEIKATKYLVNLLKNERRSEDLLHARSMLYYSFIRGYKDNRYYLDAPTYQFLLKTDMLHELKWLINRVAKKDYSFEARITYGLPITTEEYQRDVLQKVKLKKK